MTQFFSPEGERIDFASPACHSCGRSSSCSFLRSMNATTCPLVSKAVPPVRLRPENRMTDREDGLLVASDPVNRASVLAVVLG